MHLNCSDKSHNNILTKKNNISHFLCFVQLGLKTLFLLLLFIPGMFHIHNITGHYSYESSYWTITKSIDIDKFDSFFNFSLGNFATLLDSHYGDDLFCDLYIILFFIIMTFFIADFVFSIIRASKPNFAQKGQWQFILPLMMIFTFFIEIITFYNFNTVEATEYSMVKGGETYLTSYAIPEGAIWISNYRTYIDIGFLSYICLAIGAIILVLDFYIIFFSGKQKIKNTDKNKQKFFCGACGAQQNATDAFCSRCGAKRK